MLKNCNFLPFKSKFFHTGVLLATAVSLNACAESHHVFSYHRNSKEHFSESIYGKASPRVSSGSAYYTKLQKPYQIKGKWYYPQNPKTYKKVGLASWYGSAFQGRLTADGEVYDMARLTAAHPTLPLPCYARVTNLQNGSSVIVRVNDRGPYVANRLIDLSKRAAELLQYKDNGVTKVKVEYVGRAPLDTNDSHFLIASYRPGGAISSYDDDVELASNTSKKKSTKVASSKALRSHKKDPLAAARSYQASLKVPSLPSVGPLVLTKPD